MFYLFAGDYYYPEGGAADFIASFPTTEEVKEYLSINDLALDWWHITDINMNITDSGRI